MEYILTESVEISIYWIYDVSNATVTQVAYRREGGSGMGLFDYKNDLFGGWFDFNGDGKTTWEEEYIAIRHFEEWSKKNKNRKWISFGAYKKYKWRDTCEHDWEFDIDPEDYETKDEYDEALEEAKYSWRETCEDGWEFDVDPEDYETEDEYNEALEEAKYSWRDNYDEALTDVIDPKDYETEEEYNIALCQEYSRINNASTQVSLTLECPALDKLKEIKETDYPNKRQYKAAYTLANEFIIYSSNEYEQEVKARCKFIIEKSNTVIAANYLTHDGDFLYSQAIKDNFQLPITLPDEDETSEFGFSEILQKIDKKDIHLCLEVWAWCLNEFLPYTQFDSCSKESLTNYILDDLDCFSDKFKAALIVYMEKHPDFREKVVRDAADLASSLSTLIVDAITQNFPDTAKALFEDGLAIANGKWRPINNLIDGIISSSKNYDELETIEYVEQNFLPRIKTYQDGMILDEIEAWEKDIADYKQYVEQYCDRYAYTRSNSWRQTVPDGKEYGLEPLYYDSKKEYLEALSKEKYGWRQRYNNRDTCGLNPAAYETESAFLNDLSTRLDEKRKSEREKRQKKSFRTGEYVPAF